MKTAELLHLALREWLGEHWAANVVTNRSRRVRNRRLSRQYRLARAAELRYLGRHDRYSRRQAYVTVTSIDHEAREITVG